MPVTRTPGIGGGLAGLAKALEGLRAGEDLEVGIFGNRRHTRGSKPKLKDLLAWHEKGTRTIPPRRPIETYMTGRGPAEIAERAAAVLPAVLRGEADPEDAIEAIGNVAAQGIRKTIAARLPPPLNPDYAKHRYNPSGIPLDNYGQMQRAITIKFAGKVRKRL